jgi:hypothetical protein
MTDDSSPATSVTPLVGEPMGAENPPLKREVINLKPQGNTSRRTGNIKKALLLALIAVFLLQIYLYTRSEPIPLTQKPVRTPDWLLEHKDQVEIFHSIEQNFTGIEVAEKTGDFLDTLHSGGSFEDKVCTDQGRCHLTNNSGMAPLAWNAFANRGLFQATGKAEYLTAAKADMALIRQQTDGLDLFWVLPHLYEVYKASGEKEYLRLVYNSASYLLVLDTYKYKNNALSGTNTMQAAMEARSLGLLHQILFDSKDVEELKKMGALSENYQVPLLKQSPDNAINQSIRLIRFCEKNSQRDAIVYNQDGFVIRNYDCWVQLAKVQLSDDPQMLSESEGFFNNLSQATKGPKGLSTVDFTSLVETEPCVDALYRLYGATGRQEYKELAESFLQAAMPRWDIKWDYSLLGTCENDGGFFTSKRDLGGECVPSYKSHTDNAYAAYLFAQAGNKTFMVTKYEV